MSCGCNNRNRVHPMNNLYQCCQQCRCNPCSCSVPRCQEPECSSVCTALVSDNSWNVPACDSEAVISFPGLTSILIGTYLYNPTYGQFLVNGFNSINGEVTVENTCLPDNAAPGTIVPSGTEFVFSTSPQITEYTDWTPTMSASGSMTVSGVTVSLAQYFTIGSTVFFDVTLLFTLGGSAAPLVFFTLPLEGVPGNVQSAFPANVADNSGSVPGSFWRVYDADGTKALVALNGVVNWTLGAGASINIQGRYEVA